MPDSTPPSVILIICGPAGSGKTTLCDRLLEEFPDTLQRLVTTTSRRPRPGEVDGVDYHFLSPESFEEQLHAGAFIEWAKVHGRYYGSRKVHVMDALQNGRDLLLNIDVQGASAFRREKAQNPQLAGRIQTVFIQPVSLDQIRERLLDRGTDDEAEIERRLRSAREEIRQAPEFDYVIVSGSRAADYAAIREYYLSIGGKMHSASKSS